MGYHILKYEAIKAVLKAEDEHNNKLVYNLTKAVRRATRAQIQKNKYQKYYTITEQDIKYFRKAIKTIDIKKDFNEQE